MVDFIFFELFVLLLLGLVVFLWEYYLFIIMTMEFVYFVLFYYVMVFSGLVFFYLFAFYFFLIFVVSTVSALVFMICLIRGEGVGLVGLFS